MQDRLWMVGWYALIISSVFQAQTSTHPTIFGWVWFIFAVFAQAASLTKWFDDK